MTSYREEDNRIYGVELIYIDTNITVFENYSSFRMNDNFNQYASCVEESCGYILLYQEGKLSPKQGYRNIWYKHYSKSELKNITMQRFIDASTKYNEKVEALEKQQERRRNRVLTSDSIHESTEKGHYYESGGYRYEGYFITSAQFTYIEQGHSNDYSSLYQYKFVKTLSEDEESFMINDINDFDSSLSGIDFPKNDNENCIGFIPLKYYYYYYYK